MRAYAAAPGILLLFIWPLVGCAQDRSEQELQALTSSFFTALASGKVSAAESLVEGPGGAMQPLLRASGDQPDLIPSFSIERIDRIDQTTARVVVAVPEHDLTTTITLIARHASGRWRFDPEIQVETRVSPATQQAGGPTSVR